MCSKVLFLSLSEHKWGCYFYISAKQAAVTPQYALKKKDEFFGKFSCGLDGKNVPLNWNLK